MIPRENTLKCIPFVFVQSNSAQNDFVSIAARTTASYDYELLYLLAFYTPFDIVRVTIFKSTINSSVVANNSPCSIYKIC